MVILHVYFTAVSDGMFANRPFLYQTDTKLGKSPMRCVSWVPPLVWMQSPLMDSQCQISFISFLFKTKVLTVDALSSSIHIQIIKCVFSMWTLSSVILKENIVTLSSFSLSSSSSPFEVAIMRKEIPVVIAGAVFPCCLVLARFVHAVA